jgi:hypothetical protein
VRRGVKREEDQGQRRPPHERDDAPPGGPHQTQPQHRRRRLEQRHLEPEQGQDWPPRLEREQEDQGRQDEASRARRHRLAG